MAGANLAFSKVVSTPTPLAWSQAYSAGSLFAAISLQVSIHPTSETENLSTIGKDLISTLESEFFTIENKDLESIKQAVAATFSRVKEDVASSFVICYLNDNVLYLYASGGGKAILKRGEKIGTVLEGEEGDNIKSASGYVQSGDIIVLQTKQFQRIIQSPTLASSLDKNIPEEITEELAPYVHEKPEGGASAIVLSYNEGQISPEDAAVAAAAATITTENTTETEGTSKNLTNNASAQIDDQDTQVEETPEKTIETSEISEPITTPQSIEEISEIVSPIPQPQEEIRPIENPTPINLGSAESDSPFLADQKSRKLSAGFKAGRFKNLSRSRKLILLVGVILVVLIFAFSIFAIVNKRSSNNQELFNGIYNEARAKYEEGQSLMELNESLAMENFQAAQTLLQDNVDTFPQGSSEDEQIEALLAQVNTALGSDGSSSGGTSSQATEVEKSESQILSVAIDNPNANFLTQNEDFIFYLNSEGVNRLDKGNSEEEVIIDKAWKEEGGIGVFGSNIYVLDKSENIFKFVPSGDDFTKSSYVTGDDPDLSGASAMGIDGSIYVLNTDGTIDKYTKGAKEDFSISGLEKPMSGPTRIVTTEDGDNIYVLDKGNSRIVVLDKTGKFVKAYSADILKNARDIDPQEAENAVFVLSGDKVYKIATN